MIEKITGYVATCDECGVAFTLFDSDQAVFEDAFVAGQIIQDAGWCNVNGKLLCEDCYYDYLNREKEGGEE